MLSVHSLDHYSTRHSFLQHIGDRAITALSERLGAGFTAHDEVSPNISYQLRRWTLAFVHLDQLDKLDTTFDYLMVDIVQHKIHHFLRLPVFMSTEDIRAEKDGIVLRLRLDMSEAKINIDYLGWPHYPLAIR